MLRKRRQNKVNTAARHWCGGDSPSFTLAHPASSPGLDFLFLFLVPLGFLSFPSLGLYLILPVAFIVRQIADSFLGGCYTA